MQTYDVIVIGGGPGGTTAARILAQAGKKIALIEDSHWGGTCINAGCIPTKMLLGATAPQGLLHAQERVRIAKGSIQVDFTALQNRVTRFTKGTSQTLAKSLAALGIDLFEGRGVCTGQNEGQTQVQVTTAQGPVSLAGTKIILACGTASASFPGLVPDHQNVLDSTDLLRITAIPESLIVVGAGAIGLEMADFFSAMGSTVTIVEAAAHIAPTEDADIAKEMLRALTKKGITCHEGARAKSLLSVDDKARLELEDGTVITAAKALVAVGRKPNSAGLGVESAGGSLTARGYVQVDARLQSGPDLYAIGDINGLTLLAHAAEHQAAYVARHILGETQGDYEPGPVPSCVYGGTEIMRVGQTAGALLREGKTVEVSQAPLTANPIAQASGGTAGFVKVVWHEGRMAGIAAVGHGVSHLVTVAQLLIKDAYTESRLDEVMFAHPTLDEIIPAAIRAPKSSITGA